MGEVDNVQLRVVATGIVEIERKIGSYKRDNWCVPGGIQALECISAHEREPQQRGAS